MDRSTLFSDARAWLAQDPDPETRQALSDSLHAAEGGDEAAIAELESAFGDRLAFGTAGLRGEIGYGPNRMNRVLVGQAAAGFAKFLLERTEKPSIVIGYDGRHNSEAFARDTAELMAAVGIQAFLMPRMLPTPVTAFALRYLDLTAAVMVTASHNPAKDNGYKVYLGGADEGSQIISPADEQIAEKIEQIAANVSVLDLPRSDVYSLVPETVIEAYIAQTATALPTGAHDISYVYTAMHGVGWETAHALFLKAGFPEPVVVEEQRDPDPDFPTVPFPNPEEPGAMDLSFAWATEAEADLIIANDPDADRLAVAIPAGDGWRRLTGNEVGSLLGESIATKHQEGTPGALACSLVSSPILGKIAQRYGLDYAETLTGFKYVNRVPNLIFGFEEALGYLVTPQLVRDKDGVSAALAFLELAAELKAEGKTVHDALDEVVAEYGCYASDQVSVRVTDLSEIGRIMGKVRSEAPTAFAGIAVADSDDLSEGKGDWPPADVVRFWLEDGSRVIFRPSGTEPKLKVYLDVVSAEGTVEERYAAASEKLAAIKAEIQEFVAS